MAASPRILLLNGPNLNMLGVREPELYGRESLDDIVAAARTHAETLGLELDPRQSNSEGDLVTWVQEARAGHDGIIINAGALTHTSVALLDALGLAEKPVVEVHLSNIFAREAFRRSNIFAREAFRSHSYISPAASGVICGFGGQVYLLALDAIARLVRA